MQFMPSCHTLAGFQPEDDIDNLFNRLSQVEPPDGLITRILSHIERLPVPSVQLMQQEVGVGQQDTLIVRNEKRDPS